MPCKELVDKTNCILTNDIYKLIKLKTRDEICVSSIRRYDSLNNECNGLFYITVDRWEKANAHRNYVHAPVLKINDKLYINLNINNGKTYKMRSEKVLDDFNIFKLQADKLFTEEQLERMRIVFFKGVGSVPKGRISF